MDYGHTGKTVGTDTQDFFTAGAGTNSVNANNFEAENNLDLTNNDISWNNSSSNRDLRNLGGRAINSRENSPYQSENTSNLGEVVDLSMPPGVEQDRSQHKADPASIVEASLNSSVIKTKDRLDPAGVREIDSAIAKLNQTGDVADFYDTARNAMEVNLDNSYNRKLAV